MLRKFFLRDKNYELEQVQLSLEESLLSYLVDFVKVEYLLQQNPLGLDDAFSLQIKDHQTTDFRHLHEFYFTLMAIFRFEKYSDNQLDFDWDGREPNEKYEMEWTNQFKEWVKHFCHHRNFLRSVLDLTVFYPVESPVLLMDTRMMTFINSYFEVKIHPEKGIIKKSVA